MGEHDAIVGCRCNGLVCAAYLAKAGRKVLVLEKRHVVGGAACSEEIYPGFTYSVCSYVVSLLRPQIIRDLDLPRFGLSVLPLESTFTPYPDGRSLMRSADAAATRREIAAFSARDADTYPIFGKAMGQLARFAKPIIDDKAPDPMSWKPAELMKLLKMGKRLRDLGDDLSLLQYKLTTMLPLIFFLSGLKRMNSSHPWRVRASLERCWE